MRYAVMLEGQEGLSYAQIRDVAVRAESVGFDACYRSDHYASVQGREALASTDAWATIAGLARETDRIGLGTLVTPATFRPVGNLAKVVATVAEMAGTRDGAARIHLGMGTGWLEAEHRMHGFPFEDLATRFRRLEEHLEIIRGLWDPDRRPFSFDGEFETLADAWFAAAPEPRPRIIVGGTGRRKTPRLAARYADELNTVFAGPENCADARAALDAACEKEDRDPAEVPLTLMTGCIVGGSEADFRARAEATHAVIGSGSMDEWLASLEGEWVLGGPEQAADHLGRLAAAGVTGVALQHQRPDDLDMLDAIMVELAPRVG